MRAIDMKAISHRLSRLEERFASRVAIPDGWSAKEELRERLASLAARSRPTHLGPESGPDVEAARERVEQWLHSLRQRTALTDRGGSLLQSKKRGQIG